jgi:alpha-tubulin suppressor-like RCC1 family protein
MSARGCLVTLVVAGCGRIGFDAVRDGTAPGTCGLIAAAVGRQHTCVLRGDGSVVCWGYNEVSQLAMPPGPSVLAAVPIALAGPATAISAGAFHTCALLADQSVACWGQNSAGQLGDGTFNAHSGVFVVLPAGSATLIATGMHHTCAYLTDDTVKCWGGQLAPPTPTTVPGVAGVTELASGHRFTCAREASTITCWGDNGSGQLGRGTVAAGTQPAAPVVGISDAIALSAGGRFACAEHATGSVTCWGNNDTGELGIGSVTAGLAMPGQAIGLTNIAQVSGGARHACARLADGTVECWGQSKYNTTGTGDLSSYSMPRMPVAGVTDARKIVSGWQHECALLGDGTLSCWGANQYGQLGDGTRSVSETPVAAMIPNGAIGLSGTVVRTCAVYASGVVWCWGENQLGDGNEGWHGVPVMVSSLAASSTASGGSFACAIDTAKHVQCWGSNYWGQLGDGSMNPHFLPAQVSGGLVANQLSGGFDHSCAVSSAAAVLCWGHNDKGQLGDNSMTDRTVPTPVMGIASAATASAAGYAFSCAVLASGGVMCWGDNSNGQLGDGTTTAHLTAAPVSAITSATAIAAGDNHVCVLSSSGVQCWGSGTAGQLGNGMMADSAVPTAVSLPAAPTVVTPGAYHTCALLSDQTVWCWGSNDEGQLGVPGAGPSSTPVQVPNLTATNISAGRYHTCAIATDGRTLCWGDNSLGALGDGGIIAGSMARTATLACR